MTVPADADELLEVLDETGRVVGTARRSECHGDPALAHRAVHVFVRNTSGEILLQKRALSKRIQPGRWDTSVGGHVCPGESWEAAAAREFAEELGVTLGTGFRLLHDYVWRSPVETEHVRTYEVAFDGPFRPQAGEIDECRFWAEDELRAAAGTGEFTPNLEEELRRLGVL